MKLTPVLATAILAVGCGGKSKPAAPPPTPDTEHTEAPPPGPPPPDIGGYKLVAPSELTYAALNPDAPGPELAAVFGDAQTGGAFFLKIPAGHKSGVHTHTADYHAVVISGAPRHWLAGTEKAAKPLAV